MFVSLVWVSSVFALIGANFLMAPGSFLAIMVWPKLRRQVSADWNRSFSFRHRHQATFMIYFS